MSLKMKSKDNIIWNLETLKIDLENQIQDTKRLNKFIKQIYKIQQELER